jgi:hypothetical protein
MVSDNDDVISPIHSNSNSTNSQQHPTRTNKPTRSGLFTGSIFTRVRKQVDQELSFCKGKKQKEIESKIIYFIRNMISFHFKIE